MVNRLPEFAEHFGVQAIPTLVLVAPDGTIVAGGSGMRGDALEESLEKHLQ